MLDWHHMIEVIDNFLDQSYFEEVRNYITSSQQEWHLYDNISVSTLPFNSPEEYQNLSSFGFGFDVVGGSYTCEILEDLVKYVLDYFNCSEILRVRLDMTVFNPIKFKHLPHVDGFGEHKTAILYMTDSDAETVIYNEKLLNETDVVDFENLSIQQTVIPKENRLVVFDGQYLHTGHSPSRYMKRILLNINMR